MTAQPAPPLPTPSPARWLLAGLMLVLGTTGAAFLIHTVLEDPLLSLPYVSESTWQAVVEKLGGSVSVTANQRMIAELPSAPLYTSVWGLSLLSWIVGAAWLWRGGVGPIGVMLVEWGWRGWRWGLLWGAWSAAWIMALLLGWNGAVVFLARSSPLWVALFVNLWGAEWFALRRRAPAIRMALPSDPALAIRYGWRTVGLAVALSAITFTALNWGLWFNLQVPHGDSAMYEEHLWNLEHGKGFRSYLDQGLFLGEHIQVVHALLIPLHWLWPSHLLLELCEAIALALSAVPLYRIALRHSGSPRAAAYLAIATLFYFPLQYLDITIDFKTFRPNAFGVPLLLATIDLLEERRWRGMILFALLTLTAQEDYAIPLSLIGLWLAVTGGGDGVGGELDDGGERRRRARIMGTVLCVASAGYLLFVMKVALPWFREGTTIHYAGYFAKFGSTPGEILKNMLTKPSLLWGELVTSTSCLYAVYLLAPLGFLPVLSPGRLLVGWPLFVLLCLNELSQDPPGPFHHFHASLLPILLWSAAAGLRRLRPKLAAGVSQPRVCSGVQWNTAVCGARFALGSAVLTGLCYTLTPVGIRFWDTGRVVASRPTYWRDLYLPDARAAAWPAVAALIPTTARVAATDFVHARLTHCERSYDYSRYARRIAGYEDRVPDDTDYIVIDLKHPYSRSVLGEVQSAVDVRELREQPGEWELLTSRSDPYFVVLKRRQPAVESARN